MSNYSIGTWLSLPNESVAEIFARQGMNGWLLIWSIAPLISIRQKIL